MKKLLIYFITLGCVATLSTATAGDVAQRPEILSGATKEIADASTFGATAQLYDQLSLGDVVGLKALENALTGYGKLEAPNKDLLVVIDFTKPSTEERLCVIDVRNKKVLFRSHVAHGRNSGGNYATSFSNTPGSHQSSLGFYLTESTYNGKNGYSLILNGLEKGINDKAKERAIVMHGAPYCDPAIIRTAGRLGRSYGCPALPAGLNKPIIDAIKGGVLMYIHADDGHYKQNSKLI